MSLGTFQPRQRISGDKLLLNNYIGRPLLVRTNEYVEAFTSQAYPNPKPVVFCDVVDLISGQIFINVLWGGGAVVDNLKEFAGTETIMPVKPGTGSGQSGRTYQTLLALEGAEAQAASDWYNRYWGLVDQERAKREAASRPLQAAPAQQLPHDQQGFGGPVQGFQGQPNQAGQFGAPAPAQQFQQPAPQQYAQPAAAQYVQPQQGQQPMQGGQPVGVPFQGQPAQYAQPQQNPAYNGATGSAEYGAPPAQQFSQPPVQQGQWPTPGAGSPNPNPAPMQSAPQGQPMFGNPGQPPQGQAPAGMFTDGPPPGQPGQGFAAPAQQAPDAAQAALATLNQQLQ